MSSRWHRNPTCFVLSTWVRHFSKVMFDCAMKLYRKDASSCRFCFLRPALTCNAEIREHKISTALRSCKFQLIFTMRDRRLTLRAVSGSQAWQKRRAWYRFYYEMLRYMAFNQWTTMKHRYVERIVKFLRSKTWQRISATQMKTLFKMRSLQATCEAQKWHENGLQLRMATIHQTFASIVLNSRPVLGLKS